MQTRRTFLRDCSLLAATASIGPATAFAHNSTAPSMAQPQPGFAQFARLVNTSFFLRDGVKTIRLLLAEANTLSAEPDSETSGNEKFSLLFHGAAQLPLQQDTYLFEHPRLGRFSMFIVPVGRGNTTPRHYEAIFDRPLNAAELALQLSRAPQRVQKV